MLILLIAAAILVFLGYGLYNPLSVSEITLPSGKIETPVRIAQISDLHSCSYGENQTALTELIIRQEPDLICLTGDIFDDVLPDDNAETLLAELAGRYPCYYVTGNHEYRAGAKAFREKMEILKKLGITRLSNDSAQLLVRGQRLSICGVDDPDAGAYDRGFGFSDAVNSARVTEDDSAFTLLLSHRPEHFALYADCGFDLVLSGHAHGGQWRVPGLLPNGLLAPNQGLFPRYTTGAYRSGSTTMVVSRGLAKESTRIPRFYNRPEVVIVSLE